MRHKKFYSPLLLLMAAMALGVGAPSGTYAQSAKTPPASNASDLKARLARIEARIEKRRRELGIPGLSLAIVKDGKVIYSRGLGYKDLEKKIPAGPDTQFAIGSATKAFTALSVLISQDQGKISLDDPPRKYLPYFKIRNKDTDSKIQIRDLLSHSSGLSRTDLAMVTGKLNRVELIKVAGEAEPVAGLRKRFQYQNIMFAAAGEIVAQVQKEKWRDFVVDEILKPLGMTNSTMSVADMHRSRDYSLGYSYNFDTKKTRRLPARNITEVGPAGSINSTANDMAKWLLFVLREGEVNGKRLVSRRAFDEWLKPQMKITPNGSVSYGLGWFIQQWNGKKVVQHGGSIDGFNSMVAMIPEEELGFVLLTNVTASTLGNELMPVIWSGILKNDAKGDSPLSEAAKREVGTYKFPQAGFDVKIEIEEGSLVMKVPGQPTYILKNVEGRKYRLSNAPDGFFITFKDREAFLEQPQGNFTLPKAGLGPAAKKESAEAADDPVKKLIGRYESDRTKGNFIEIKEVNGKTSLVVGSQPPYQIVRKDGDEYRYASLPETYGLRVRRKGSKQLSGIVLIQPQGEFPFTRTSGPEQNAPSISVKEIQEKMIEALGGAANWMKITSSVTDVSINFVNQGVTAEGTIYAKAPDSAATDFRLSALGKRIGHIRSFFDGKGGGEWSDFSPFTELTGQRLEDVRFQSDFYGLLDLGKKTQKAELRRPVKIGGEEVYTLVLTPKKASRFVLYVSTKTFLPVRKRITVVSSTSSQKIPVTESYSEYRDVDGLMVPFKVVTSHPAMGRVITRVKKITHNVKIPEKRFHK